MAADGDEGRTAVDMTLTQAIWKVEEIREMVEDREDKKAIDIVLEELKSAIYCRSCNGQGKRWYAGYGTATCDDCKGSGKRR